MLFGSIVGVLVLLIVMCIIRKIRHARFKDDNIASLHNQIGINKAPKGQGRTSLAPFKDDSDDQR